MYKAPNTFQILKVIDVPVRLVGETFMSPVIPTARNFEVIEDVHISALSGSAF